MSILPAMYEWTDYIREPEWLEADVEQLGWQRKNVQKATGNYLSYDSSHSLQATAFGEEEIAHYSETSHQM